jgi:hypothetical protein
VRAGTYVVLCFLSRPTDTRQSSNEPVPPQAIYVATRLDVTGERDVTTTSILPMVAEGQPAPPFTLPSDSGEDVSLESFRGRPVVLYFYPKG